MHNIEKENGINEHKIEWLIMIYEGSDPYNPIIAHFKSWAREKLFQLNNLKLAVLDATHTTMLSVEQDIPSYGYPRLYYIKFPTFNGKKILKHKMLNVLTPNQLDTALKWIQHKEWDPYYFSELITNSNKIESLETISPRFKKLVRDNYYQTVQDRTAHLFIVLRKSGTLIKQSNIVDEFFEKIKNTDLEPKFKFYHINVELNDIEVEMNGRYKYMLHLKDEDQVHTSSNIDSLETLIRFIGDKVKEVNKLIPGYVQEEEDIDDDL